MRSRLVSRQNVRRHVYKLDQPTLLTEAPARVLGTCLMVVATAKMIARPNATENAAKIKRGAITCSQLAHLDCINFIAVDLVWTAAWRDRGRIERPGAIRKFSRWQPPRLSRTLETKFVSMTIVLIREQCRIIERPLERGRQRFPCLNLKR
jgi:hypothetical protein